MTTPATTEVQHEPFCLPRPGNDEVRMESWLADKYDGEAIVGKTRVVRCIECGAACYTPL